MMSDKITWTEIAIQLTGEVPESCHMTADGGLMVKRIGKRGEKFSAKEVEDAIEALDEIGKAKKESGEKRVENRKDLTMEETKLPPTTKPKAEKPKANTTLKSLEGKRK